MSEVPDGGWAQVRGEYASALHQGLIRGAWYEIQSSVRRTGMVKLDADGHDEEVHAELLRFRKDRPSKAARVHSPATMQVKEPGEPGAMMTDFAVCPERHELGEITMSQSRVDCPECGCKYEIE